MCLEISENEKIVFVGGSDNIDIYSGNPIISAFKFNEYLIHIDTLQLYDKKMRNIFQLKKMVGSNILIAGGFNSISLVEFKEDTQNFVELKQLSNLHTGEIFDFVVRNDDIFSVCSKDAYIHRF